MRIENHMGQIIVNHEDFILLFLEKKVLIFSQENRATRSDGNLGKINHRKTWVDMHVLSYIEIHKECT